MRQWEIWKGKPEGFEKEHWFVITSGAERCDDPRSTIVNGLACFTLRGPPTIRDVVLDAADGFEQATACVCDFFFALKKSTVHSSLGSVSWERQQQIKAKVKEVLRF